MYEAKRAGKNTVRVHGPGSLLPDRPDGKAAPLDPELNWLPWTDTQGRGVRGVVAAYRGPEVWDEAARRGSTDVLAQSLLQQALEAWCQWRDGGFAPPRLTIGIQAAELGAADFVARRMAALQQHGVAPAVLELQLFEDAVPALQPHALDQLQELQRAGVRLAVAGVGATDAALRPLARLPLDALELDPRLVAEMARGDRTARAVCAALVALGTALGVERRAAGVEDAAAAAACRQIGCDGLAGSEESGWMSTQDCGAWLAERNRMAAGGTA
jgi:EAL domain-containing protein (putative c-di-GMP-specific phosphodiesterase class I)